MQNGVFNVWNIYLFYKLGHDLLMKNASSYLVHYLVRDTAITLPKSIVLLIFICSLINLDTFGSPSLFAVLTTSFISFFALSYASYLLLFNKTQTDFNFLGFFLLGFLFLIYIFIISFVRKQNLALKHFQFLSYYSFLLSTYVFLRLKLLGHQFVLKLIGLLLITENAICIAQYFGIIRSANEYFTVTGSWINPNVTGMFISITLPVIFYKIFRHKEWAVLLWLIILAISSIWVLHILKCRSGILMSSFTLVILIVMYFINKRKMGNWGVKKIISVVLSFIFLIVLLLSFFYHLENKKISTQNRFFIWEISLNIIKNHWLTGIGVGRFEHDYNLEQAHYFESTIATIEEKKRSDYVRSAYNEIIQNFVEVGVIGLLLIFLISFELFKITRKSLLEKLNSFPDNTSELFFVPLFGIISIAILSLFNFTVEAVPVFYVACIFVSMTLDQANNLFNTNYVTQFKKKRDRYSLKVGKNNSKIVQVAALFFLFLGAYLLLLQIKFNKAMYLNKKAEKLISKMELVDANIILKKIYPELKNNEIYLRNQGRLHFVRSNFRSSIYYFTQIKEYSSDPFIYISLGRLYNYINDVSKSKEYFQIANKIQPSLITPYFELFKLAQMQNDTLNIYYYGKIILSSKPKVNSKVITNYKIYVKSYLKILTDKSKNN